MVTLKTKPIAQFSTPFAKQVEILEVSLENNVTLLRVRIREGKRFTILDLDPVSAKLWAETMSSWANNYSDSSS